MKTHFTILADDLSGAADCAVPFARAGFLTEVFLHPEIFARTNPPVGAIDLHTRELASDEASQLTSQALRLIQSDRETVWYRKVDSTLRGNIGSDVLSTVRGIPGKRVIFCAPAFPDTGRTTAHGKVFVRGVPLEESGVHQKGVMSSKFCLAVQFPSEVAPALDRRVSTATMTHVNLFRKMTHINALERQKSG